MNRIQLLPLLLIGCAHTAPEQLTVHEQRAEAARHGQISREERGQYKPRAEVRRASGADVLVYNPTERHLDAADDEFRVAANHLAAAKWLTAFQDKACKDIEPSERAGCPLPASSVSQVRYLSNGLRLEFKGWVAADDTSRRLNCHLAYAISTGFDRSSCPLFVEGMQIQLVEASVIELTAATAEAVGQMHAEAQRLFSSSVAMSAR